MTQLERSRLTEALRVEPKIPNLTEEKGQELQSHYTRGSYHLKLLASALFEVWVSMKQTWKYKAHREIISE